MTITPDQIFMREVQYQTIFNWMEENQVQKIISRFNGEGDSGSFNDDLELVYDGPYDHNKYTSLQYGLNNTKISTMNTKPGQDNTLWWLIADLSETIETEAKHSVDWYNNDGGSGSVEWILDGEGEDGNHYTKGICLTVSARVIEYEHHYFSITGEAEAL